MKGADKKWKDAKFTIDTGVCVEEKVEKSKLVSYLVENEFDVAMVTVSKREDPNNPLHIKLSKLREVGVYGESVYGSARYGGCMLETAVIGESIIGECRIGNSEECNLLEAILNIISNNSFPKEGEREALTPGQLNQLRDAMILESHVYEGRDVFVTTDKKAFINNGRREILQIRYRILIYTPEELQEVLELA